MDPQMANPPIMMIIIIDNTFTTGSANPNANCYKALA